MSQEDEILDEWQLALFQAKESLEKCQHSRQYTSCLGCSALLACEIRDAYVKAVYDSMSKGQGGGFEF